VVSTCCILLAIYIELVFSAHLYITSPDCFMSPKMHKPCTPADTFKTFFEDHMASIMTV
jgi:hypothetical protein